MARRMSVFRRAWLSELGKAQFAALPKNATCRKCETQIISSYIFCRDCWSNVSDEKRAAINAAFVPGTGLRSQPKPEYWAAIEEACR